MSCTTLIDPHEAAGYLEDPEWVFVDTRFVLAEPDAGRAAYRASHIAGAVYAGLDRDLSSKPVPGQTGRHPLPLPADLDATLSRLGIDHSTQVVSYDASHGAMAAARLWWLLRWAGHPAAAVLDGGFTLWQAAGLPCSSGEQSRAPRHFAGGYQPGMVATAAEVSAAGPQCALFDARTRDRFRGENEALDPVAGHIPGARSLPYVENAGSDGRFQPGEQLRERLAAALAGAPAASAIVYCGSGVTAAHEVLAFAHAGLELPKLYAGSWSEWITNSARDIATGDG